MKWNGSYEVKTSRGDDNWSIEAKIPFVELGIGADTHKKWGINFRRKQPRMKSAADWLSPITFDPDTYGELILE